MLLLCYFPPQHQSEIKIYFKAPSLNKFQFLYCGVPQPNICGFQFPEFQSQCGKFWELKSMYLKVANVEEHCPIQYVEQSNLSSLLLLFKQPFFIISASSKKTPAEDCPDTSYSRPTLLTSCPPVKLACFQNRPKLTKQPPDLRNLGLQPTDFLLQRSTIRSATKPRMSSK